jgi:hypothetical protein
LYLEEVGEPAEYVEGSSRCTECGEQLVSERPLVGPVPARKSESNDLVEVFTLRNPFEADVVRDALQDSGIDCEIRENLAGVFGGTLSSGWGEVLVSEEQAQAAEGIIEEAISSLEAEAELTDADEPEVAEQIEPVDIEEMVYPALKPASGLSKRGLGALLLGLLVLERLLAISGTIESHPLVPVLLGLGGVILLSLKD